MNCIGQHYCSWPCHLLLWLTSRMTQKAVFAAALRTNGPSKKISKQVHFYFFRSDRKRNRTDPERIPNGSRTDPERTPYGPRTDPVRTPYGPRTDPIRIPYVPRTGPVWTPNGPQTNPERPPNSFKYLLGPSITIDQIEMAIEPIESNECSELIQKGEQFQTKFLSEVSGNPKESQVDQFNFFQNCMFHFCDF